MELIGECKGNNGNGCFMDSCGHDCGCFVRKLGYETLEEAAENYNLNTINAFGDYESFIAGAKWQQEKSYSEEEVLKILASYADWSINDIREWFEQYKKK